MKRSGKKWLSGFFLFLLIVVVPGAAPGQESLPPKGKPLTLEQCIGLALKYQPALQAGQATIAAQKARVEQALAAYYPQVNFNSTYNTSTANFSTAGGTTARTGISSYNWTFYDIFSMGPTLNQLIYDFGRTSSTVKISRENQNATEQDLQTAVQNVVLNVKQTYYVALQSLALIKVAEDTLDQSQKRLEQAKGFYQAGTRPKIDVTNAEVNLANVQLGLIRARNNYQVARANLNNAMGLRENLHFAIEEASDFKPRAASLEEILQSAYARRPEILQIKSKQRGQEATVDLARAGYYPTLAGNASNLYRTDRPPQDFAWDWSFGVTMTVPIFSGFSTPNQIAEAKANLKNLEAQEESLRQNIRLEAEQAFLSLKEAMERITVTEKTLDQAKENYDLASGRYRVGVGQPLEITDAEVLLANSRANHIQALYDYKVAEAKIDKAMGLSR
jgi:outer membrane protein TolC